MAAERGAEALIFKVAPSMIAVSSDPAAVAAMTQEMGSPSLLAAVAAQALDVAPDVVAWACTSGSFLGDAGRKVSQAAAMSAALGGTPATTTSLAIVDWLEARGIRHVAAVTPYHPEIGMKFVDFLHANGFVVDAHAHAGCGSDAEVGALTLQDLAPLIRSAIRSTSDAVVIPCTALRRQDIEQRVLDDFGLSCILANAATLDHAVKLARARD